MVYVVEKALDVCCNDMARRVVPDEVKCLFGQLYIVATNTTKCGHRLAKSYGPQPLLIQRFE
jgi:hypothetical protein